MRSRAMSAPVICTVVASLTLAGCQVNPATELADLVLVNGTVITVDPDDSIAEAVAIRGGKIAAVGSTVEIEALVGPNTRRIDLDGLTVTPGLLDAHAHFSPSCPTSSKPSSRGSSAT